MKERWSVLFLLFMVVTIAWGAYWVALIYGPLTSWTERGTFGDMFGALNALFSGLAFSGVIFAVLLQSKELQLQRLQNEENRKEMARSALALELAEKAQKEQAELQALSMILSTYVAQMSDYPLGSGGRASALSNVTRIREQLESRLNLS